MQDTIIRLIEQHGYMGIFILIFIENIFPPIPSEVILLFGGYVSHKSILNTWLVIASATTGSLLGAVVLYLVSNKLGKERIKKLLSGKIGHFLFLSAESVEKADRWFQKFGGKAVFLCRCIPVVRSIVSVPAGISKMNFRKFLILTCLGSIIWNTAITWAGYLAGDTWQTVQTWLGVYSDIVLAAIVIVAVVALIILSVRRKNKCKVNLKGEK